MQVQAKTSEDIQLDCVTPIEKLLCKTLLHSALRPALSPD